MGKTYTLVNHQKKILLDLGKFARFQDGHWELGGFKRDDGSWLKGVELSRLVDQFLMLSAHFGGCEVIDDGDADDLAFEGDCEYKYVYDSKTLNAMLDEHGGYPYD